MTAGAPADPVPALAASGSVAAGAGATFPAAARRRVRNRRGEGRRLREEIVTTATALLISTGSPEAVTLRAVARRIGIATTSIYAHFPDRAAILQAVADRAFTSLTAAALRAGEGVADPVARLVGGCRAYVDFARDHPQLYALMFTTAAAPGAPRGSREREPGDALPDDAPSQAGFTGLARAIGACIDAGASTSTDAAADAVAVWMALHGFATLRASMTFAWPDEQALLQHLVLSLARIPPAAASGAR